MLVNDFLTEDKVKGILEYLGATKLNSHGDMIRSTCPIHKGDNESAFAWNLKTNLWYCHTKCKTGGDILNLYALVHDLDIRCDFEQILRCVCAMLGVDPNQIDMEKQERSNRKELAAWYKFVGREIENPEYNIELIGETKNIKAYRGFEKDFLIENEVFFVPSMNRIAFTLKDDKGVTVGVSCRTISNEKPKWLHRPKGIDTGIILYNLDKIKGKYSSVHLVEGITDVLQLKKLGIENVVCTFGANVTDEQVRILMKYFTELIFMYDNDLAGRLANLKGIEKTKHCFDLKVAEYSHLYINDPGEILDEDKFNEINIMRADEYESFVKGEDGNDNNN